MGTHFVEKHHCKAGLRFDCLGFSNLLCTNNNKILDTNKITASSLFSRNKNPIELKSNEAPVDVSKKETQISPVLSNIEVDVWDKNTYLKKIII